MLLNYCFCSIGEDSWESLDCREIQPVHPKGDQSWVFTGRTDVEAEAPVLWPPDVKSWLIGKDPDSGKDWGQEKKVMTEDEMRMASLTQWTWVWVDFGSWWWTGRPGVLWFMGSQRVRHSWATELSWYLIAPFPHFYYFDINSINIAICILKVPYHMPFITYKNLQYFQYFHSIIKYLVIISLSLTPLFLSHASLFESGF